MSKTVLFLCRGNAFRSILAEAYLKSKQLPDIEVLSAGTVATQNYNKNRPGFTTNMPSFAVEHKISEFIKDHHGDQVNQEMLDRADVVVLFNDVVKREAMDLGLSLPKNTEVWSVVDIGEPGRMPKDDNQELQFREDAYKEIKDLIDNLVDDILQVSSLRRV